MLKKATIILGILATIIAVLFTIVLIVFHRAKRPSHPPIIDHSYIEGNSEIIFTNGAGVAGIFLEDENRISVGMITREELFYIDKAQAIRDSQMLNIINSEFRMLRLEIGEDGFIMDVRYATSEESKSLHRQAKRNAKCDLGQCISKE